jgi:predicted secreted Zn-dependent protease
MMNSKLIAAVLMAVLISPAGAANVAKTYSYFSIGGSTLDAIQKQLDSRGPEVKTTGHRHPGATQMEFVSRIGYQKGANGCSIATASVTVKAKIILPHWRRPHNADGDVRLVWDTLSADIKRHEESHVIIAKNHARMLEQALLAVPRQADCKATQAKAALATQKVLAKHDAAQVEFDRVEGINFERRIVRLLRYRLERVASGELRG